MESSVVVAAREMAEVFHVDQRRKYTGYPYVEHCERVACWTALTCGDPEVVAAAWLHDALEDTPLPPDTIEKRCGPRVLSLVLEVTDVSRPEDGNRTTRKSLDREHLALASRDGKTIKLADLIDNTLSIATYDSDFARVYLEEKEALLPVLEGGSRMLHSLASRVLVLAQQSLVRLRSDL